MKSHRYFCGTAGAAFLVAMVVGFHQFVANGKGAGGRVIDPSIFRLDLTHGLVIAAWYILFFIQALLIAVKSHRIHFKLGWAVVVIAPIIAVNATLVAIRSVQISPPDFQFVGMQYSRFLLVMPTESIFYTVFVAIGLSAGRSQEFIASQWSPPACVFWPEPPYACHFYTLSLAPLAG